MPKVPDEVIFGRDLSNENTLTYGDVRKITDKSLLIGLLERRLFHFFLNQVEPLKQSRSAFPLATLTCIGIETLGQVFILEDKDDSSFQFVEILKSLNQIFSRKMTKKYGHKLQEIWATKDLKKVDNYAKIIYRFFRNTMIHGYQAQGMFLSYEGTQMISVEESSAFLIINPDWFWDIFKDSFYNKFEEVIIAPESNHQRINCLNYIQTFLLA